MCLPIGFSTFFRTEPNDFFDFVTCVKILEHLLALDALDFTILLFWHLSSVNLNALAVEDLYQGELKSAPLWSQTGVVTNGTY
jgi:hypothetical protein